MIVRPDAIRTDTTTVNCATHVTHLPVEPGAIRSAGPGVGALLQNMSTRACSAHNPLKKKGDLIEDGGARGGRRMRKRARRRGRAGASARSSRPKGGRHHPSPLG